MVGEELDDPALEPLARDGEHSLAKERVRGRHEGDVAEEGMERRESGVTAAGGVATFALEVVEELAEEGSVEIGELEPGWSSAEACCREAQEQTEGVAVGGHRVWARPPLLEQAVGEEGLQERGKIGGAHGNVLRTRVARSAASWRSSGTASMYQ